MQILAKWNSCEEKENNTRINKRTKAIEESQTIQPQCGWTV